MANKKNKNTEQNQENQEVDKKKFSLNKVIIYLLVVLLASAGSVFAYIKITTTKKVEERHVFDLGENTYNLQPGSKSFLKTTMTLEFVGKKTEEKLTEHLPSIKDAVLDVVSDKSGDEMDTSVERNVLSKEIVKEINEILHGDYAKDVFFVNFILQ